MIQFSESIGFWSIFVFWFCIINIIITIVFTIVVIIGGCFDLKYLFRALKEDIVDETDDGRVLVESSESKQVSDA